MKSNFKIIFTLFLTILVSVSCSKEWLDVNTDPNNPATSTPELTLPAGTVSVGANIGGYYNLLGGFWSQYWSQSNAANQYKYIDQYQITDNSTMAQFPWREMFANGLSDLQFVINESKAKNNWSLHLMGTVIQAYGWQVMVDLFDDVPYTESFQGDATVQNFSPKYDKGLAIYKDLIARIDTALSKSFNELSPEQAKGDMLWPSTTLTTDARMAKWVSFANTLKLKMYMRMMYVDAAFAQAGVEKLYADGADFLTENAHLNIYVNQENKDNPLYASNVRKLNVATNLRVSASLYRYLEQNSDPRLAVYVGSGNLPMPQGGFNIPSPSPLNAPSVAIFKQSATDPVYFISLVESELLQAEAVAKGWGVGDDKALYDAAVTNSFSRSSLDAAPFIADTGIYNYPVAGTFEEKQEAIMMAKWVAFAGSQSLEMFFETNRTHYPRVSSEPAWVDGAYNINYVGGLFTYSMEGTTSNKFPKRLPYPQDEVNLNANFPGQKLVTDKVWWDVKP